MTWNIETVILLLEKLVGLAVGLVRVFKTPDAVLKRIVDLSAVVREQDAKIDAELASIRAARVSVPPPPADTDEDDSTFSEE